MNNTEKETLHGNVNPTINSNYSENKELVENVHIEDTPFMARRMDDKWIMTVGKYKVAGPFKTLEEVKEASTDISWDTLTTVISAILDAHEEMKRTPNADLGKPRDERKISSVKNLNTNHITNLK